jgi:hypothetical protein
MTSGRISRNGIPAIGRCDASCHGVPTARPGHAAHSQFPQILDRGCVWKCRGNGLCSREDARIEASLAVASDTGRTTESVLRMLHG